MRVVCMLPVLYCSGSCSTSVVIYSTEHNCADNDAPTCSSRAMVKIKFTNITNEEVCSCRWCFSYLLLDRLFGTVLSIKINDLYNKQTSNGLHVCLCVSFEKGWIEMKRDEMSPSVEGGPSPGWSGDEKQIKSHQRRRETMDQPFYQLPIVIILPITSVCVCLQCLPPERENDISFALKGDNKGG